MVEGKGRKQIADWMWEICLEEEWQCKQCKCGSARAEGQCGHRSEAVLAQEYTSVAQPSFSLIREDPAQVSHMVFM